MANKLAKFQEWLLDERRFRMAWFAKDPHLTPEPDEALAYLPDDVADELRTAVNELPVNPREEEAVLEALRDAIAQWQKDPHLASNSMVILAHPVSSLSRILVESLHNMRSQKGDPLDINLLDWVERPPDSGSIKAQIEEKLCDRKSDEDPDEAQTLAVIPNLCWCFLRSADGLEGVDYLQETLLGDRSQFWVIGSGQVGWQYLKSTMKFHAYCGRAIDLPALTGQELQTWFQPIIDRFNIQFSDAAIHKRFDDPQSLLNMDLSPDKPIEAISEISQEVTATVESSLRAAKDQVFSAPEEAGKPDSDDGSKREYFERLSDISDGVSVVALQLFIKSLRYRDVQAKNLNKEPEKAAGDGRPQQRPVPPDDESSKTQPPEDAEKALITSLPKLPPLPELGQDDLYLLYSLMLHGDLTIGALANSLGDSPQVVNNQVQVLRNAGVIEQKNGVIKANPVHYPKLRRELSRNNFIIEVP